MLLVIITIQFSSKYQHHLEMIEILHYVMMFSKLDNPHTPYHHLHHPHPTYNRLSSVSVGEAEIQRVVSLNHDPGYVMTQGGYESMEAAVCKLAGNTY